MSQIFKTDSGRLSHNASMRNLITTLTLLLCCMGGISINVRAQETNRSAPATCNENAATVSNVKGQAQVPASLQLAEMKKLDFLVGQWKGDGWIEFAPGQRRTFTQTETVQSKLSGLVLLIEGLGKGKTSGSEQEVTVHNALGVVSYDNQAKLFRWRAYQADGRSVDTEAKVTDRSLEWGFGNAQMGNIRFTIQLTEAGQWFEIGEVSRDGKNWKKFFEMTLQRLK